MTQPLLTKKRVAKIFAIVMTIYFAYSFSDFRRGFLDAFKQDEKAKAVHASLLSKNTIVEDYRVVNLLKM